MTRETDIWLNSGGYTARGVSLGAAAVVLGVGAVLKDSISLWVNADELGLSLPPSQLMNLSSYFKVNEGRVMVNLANLKGLAEKASSQHFNEMVQDKNFCKLTAALRTQYARAMEKQNASIQGQCLSDGVLLKAEGIELSIKRDSPTEAGNQKIRLHLGPAPDRYIDMQIAPDSSIVWGQGSLGTGSPPHSAGRADVAVYSAERQKCDRMVQGNSTGVPPKIYSDCFFGMVKTRYTEALVRQIGICAGQKAAEINKSEDAPSPVHQQNGQG